MGDDDWDPKIASAPEAIFELNLRVLAIYKSALELEKQDTADQFKDKLGRPLVAEHATDFKRLQQKLLGAFSFDNASRDGLLATMYELGTSTSCSGGKRKLMYLTQRDKPQTLTARIRHKRMSRLKVHCQKIFNPKKEEEQKLLGIVVPLLLAHPACTPNRPPMHRSISKDQLPGSMPKVSSMISLLHLGDDADIEDMANRSAHSPANRETSQIKAIQEIYQDSPKLSLEFSKSQQFLCPNCRRATCRVSKPPTGYYSLQQISQHNKPGDCWLIANGIVYDASRYLVRHPGGIETILSRAGSQDASRDFDFHTESGKRVWKKLAVGKVAECDQQDKDCSIM